MRLPPIFLAICSMTGHGPLVYRPNYLTEAINGAALEFMHAIMHAIICCEIQFDWIFHADSKTIPYACLIYLFNK